MCRSTILAALLLCYSCVLAQSKQLLRSTLRAHSPKKMGYRIQWGVGLQECGAYRGFIRMTNGECYVRTNRKGIKVESNGLPFNMITESKHTAFNICNYYSQDSVTYIAMYKGRAELSVHGRKIYLDAGEFAKITDTLIVAQMVNYEYANELDRSWTKNGYYHFYNKPVSMIINRIARSHGLAVKYIKKPTSLISGELSFYKWALMPSQLAWLMRRVRFGNALQNDTLIIY